MSPIALTIAGSDCSGGAGIQADLKTFSALGVYGASVIAALTAENTKGVQAFEVASPAIIRAQIDSVFDDLDVRAVKIGMLGNAAAAVAVAEGLRAGCRAPVVLDPVMVAASGDALLDEGAERTLIRELFPLADLITPNLGEAARLLGTDMAEDEDAMGEQARKLHAMGPKAVLVKGGHGAGAEAVDLLWDGSEMTRLAAPRVATRHGHGTGCTLSAAIAAGLAKGAALGASVAEAKAYLTEALAQADTLQIGSGSGPVHHFYALWPADRS